MPKSHERCLERRLRAHGRRPIWYATAPRCSLQWSRQASRRQSDRDRCQFGMCWPIDAPCPTKPGPLQRREQSNVTLQKENVPRNRRVVGELPEGEISRTHPGGYPMLSKCVFGGLLAAMLTTT